MAKQVARKNTPEARKIRKKKKLTGYQKLLKSKLENEKRQKRLLVSELRFCQEYGHKLKIPSEENWRGKLRKDLIPEHLRGNKNKGMWV